MNQTRREFLASSATMAVGAAMLPALVGNSPEAVRLGASVPWYRRTLRWGQTNITEADAADYDIGWWRQYWKRTRVQGIIVNAGGIVAYYPSRFPLQYRPPTLGQRDLLGELVQAARADGLVVLARMDSNRTHEDFYRAHADWFAMDASGRPYKAGDLFVTCINSPYYEEYIPDVLREIATRYRPEGFTDNSWSGLGRDSICFCENCRKKFGERGGKALPRQANWDDAVYRDWILWNYARRLEVWELNNRVTRSAGGPDCIWAGMNSGSVAGQCQSFRDYREICARAEIIMLDHQARGDAGGFQQNGEAAKLVHGLLGWDKLIPESMAMYQAGRPTFRKTVKPAPEARLWMLDGLAGGLQLWWHHVGASQEDRRQFLTAEPICRWHEANQEYLVNRQPMANVGLVWSQRNTDFYGRNRVSELVEQPWRGWSQALVRARIPYLPIHADDLERDRAQFSALILPNMGALSDAQLASIRSFVARGGALIATGRTSLYDEWGQSRRDFALADLFGAHFAGQPGAAQGQGRAAELHSYLRIEGGSVSPSSGGQLAKQSGSPSRRHEILRGFEETDILPFGGWLGEVSAEPGAEVLLTFVPSFPTFPPETSWMREPRTSIPGLVLHRTQPGGRVAFLPADLDRRYASDNLPDHGDLLANLVRWAVGGNLPLRVDGPGLIDCHLYRQENHLILHLVNLTNSGTWRAPVEELIPVGPLKIKVTLPERVRARTTHLLVANRKAPASFEGSAVTLTLLAVLDHEVVLIGA